MRNLSQSLKENREPAMAIKKQKRCCKNCVKGKPVRFSTEVLCWEKGIVSEDYCCSSHHFFVKDEIKKREPLRCSDCEFFILHPNDFISTYGVCDLFSVRKCDGSIKKACSRFVRRKEQTA